MKRVSAITHPCLTPVRMGKGFSPVEEDSCSNLAMKKSRDGDEVGSAPKSGQDWTRLSKRASQLMESKALVKSTNAMNSVSRHFS